MITIIAGSMRKNAESKKVGEYITEMIKQSKTCESVNLISLHDLQLPLWSEESYANAVQWEGVSQQLKASSAFIFITPEWDGMASPAIKNFFNYCRNYELFHKPALLVSVSAGEGGTYPIAELRMSSYKNARVCYIPEHIIVKHVVGVLNDAVPVNENDQYIRNRIDFALSVLKEYQTAFEGMNTQLFNQNKAFINGM